MNTRPESVASDCAAQLEALLNSNWHPVVGAGGWSLNDQMLTDHLRDAEIHDEQDCGPVVAISGWLSPLYGVDGTGSGHAFLCLKAKGESQNGEFPHTLFAPTAELDSPVRWEASAVDTNGRPLTEDD